MDEQKNSRLLKKFQKKTNETSLVRCYKNKLELGCSYIKEIEDQISKVCEVAHVDEHLPDWLKYLD